MAQRRTTATATAEPAYQLVSVLGPAAGVDLRTSQSLLARDRARTLVNFSLTEPGTLVVRPGYRQFSTTSLGAARIQGARRIYLTTAIPLPASTQFTLVAWQGGIYGLSDSGGWVSTTASLSGLSTGAEIHFVHDRDLVVPFDGVSTALFKSTNGSSWTHFGIQPGLVNSTASSKAGGSLSTSEFEFGYTYKDRDLAYESNESSLLSTVSFGSTGAAEIQVPNSTDPQVDAIVIYARNKTAGETVRRKASSGPVQVGAHSTITITSSGWLSNDEAPTTHHPPPSTGLSFGIVWKARWWARATDRTNRLYFTELFLPQAWPPLFYIDLPFPLGDQIQALAPVGDVLFVLGTTTIFVVLGQTALDFEVRPVTGSQDGALGPRAWTVVNGEVVHAGGMGVSGFSGAADRLLSVDLDPAWRDLLANGTVLGLSRTALVYDQQHHELRVAVDRRYPSGTAGEWVLDLNRSRGGVPAWTATDRPIGGYLVWDGPETVSGNRGRLFSWPNAARGTIDEEMVGTTANSSAVVAEYEGPGLTLGAHRARWIDLHGEYEPHTGVFTTETLIDGASQGARTVAIGTGLAAYGTAVYGTAQYGGSARRKFHVNLPLGADGGTAVQKFTYTGTEAFRLYGYHLGFVPEPAIRDLTE